MENLEQLVEISSNSHTEISNLKKKSSRSIFVKILPSVCSIITLIEENVKLETDLSSATFKAIYSYKDARKNRIFLSVSKTILTKKRTHHRSTCQAFPCDNQCQAVDTTLSWSAWGMVRLLITICERKNIYMLLFDNTDHSPG